MSDSTGPGLFPELDPPLKITRWRPKATVEAVRLDSESDWEKVAEWCHGALLSFPGEDPERCIVVPTRYAGLVNATEGNWIVKASHGFIVYEATLFADVHDPADES